MKTCPKCSQTYTDADLNFCLYDGELLIVKDNTPPTIFMDAPRTTNPNWQTNANQNTWQNQQMTPPNQQTFQPNSNSAMMQTAGQNQNLPLISLILGIGSLSGVCCSLLGIPLGLAAIITGFIGMNNANNKPMEYGGKGLAIGGMITGAITLVLSILFMFLGLIGNIFN